MRSRAAGCRLFVATSKPHHYARPILERFDLARRFAGIHGPELDGTNDNKADLIAHIIAARACDARRAVMIGDREFDVAAAARNGIPTVGVTWGYGSRAELKPPAPPLSRCAVALGSGRAPLSILLASPR